ncbi:MAG: hypothetical protein HKN08_01885, partial [Gammaproteobacteria bacterium]|nr:hypothetical protein [Gammaproteobacteria bacterium]
MVDGPVTKRKISRRTKRNAIYGVVAVVLLAAIGTVVTGLMSGGGPGVDADVADTQELNQLARSNADAISDYFDNIGGQLTEYANSQSTKSLFESGSDEDLI